MMSRITKEVRNSLAISLIFKETKAPLPVFLLALWYKNTVKIWILRVIAFFNRRTMTSSNLNTRHVLACIFVTKQEKKKKNVRLFYFEKRIAKLKLERTSWKGKQRLGEERKGNERKRKKNMKEQKQEKREKWKRDVSLSRNGQTDSQAAASWTIAERLALGNQTGSTFTFFITFYFYFSPMTKTNK